MWFVTDFAVWKIVTIARVLFLTVCRIQLYTDQVKLKLGPAVYACNPCTYVLLHSYKWSIPFT